MVAMLFVSICLFVLFGLSLYTFADLRRKPASCRSAYALPPADWPDVPIETLGLFRREGRINQTVVRSSARSVVRLTSFSEAQSFVLDQVDPAKGRPPDIALRLSKTDGADWTDVVLDGRVIAQMPTSVLAPGSASQTASAA